MRMYLKLVAMTIKSGLEYKVSFILEILSSTLLYLADFVVIYFFVLQVDSINGWVAHEIILLQILVVTASSLDSFLSFGLRRFAQVELVSGNFDLKLMKPVNPLMILFGSVNVGGLAIFPFLLVVIPIMVYIQPEYFTLMNVIWMLLTVIGGTIIFTSLKLISSAIGFFTLDSESFYRITKIGTRPILWYPLNIYPKLLQLLFLTIIPIGFVSFVPAHIIVNKEFAFYWILPYLSLPIGLIFFAIALYIWGKGIKKYEGSSA